MMLLHYSAQFTLARKTINHSSTSQCKCKCNVWIVCLWVGGLDETDLCSAQNWQETTGDVRLYFEHRFFLRRLWGDRRDTNNQQRQQQVVARNMPPLAAKLRMQIELECHKYRMWRALRCAFCVLDEWAFDLWTVKRMHVKVSVWVCK